MKSILKGLLVSFLIILSVELAARIIKTIIDDYHHVGISDSMEGFQLTPGSGWELRPNFKGVIFDKPCIVDRNGFLLEDGRQMKDSKNPVIAFLGDSWTFGNHVSVRETFVELLDDMFPDMSVINMGVPGYTSFQGYQAIETRALKLNPALIIVAFNFNDRRYVLQEAEMDSPSKFAGMSAQEERENLVNCSYLFRFINYMKRKSMRLVYEKNPVDQRTLYARVPPDAYRQNLQNMATLCRENNIPLIFFLFKNNPDNSKFLLKGIRALNRSDHDSAINYLKKSVSSESYVSPLARKYLAEIYRRKSMVKEADEILKIKDPYLSLHGGHVIYSAREYNRIMQEVAEKNDIEVVDPKSVLGKHSFLDMGHLNRKGHEQLAQLLFGIVKSMLSQEQES